MGIHGGVTWKRAAGSTPPPAVPPPTADDASSPPPNMRAISTDAQTERLSPHTESEPSLPERPCISCSALFGTAAAVLPLAPCAREGSALTARKGVPKSSCRPWMGT